MHLNVRSPLFALCLPVLLLLAFPLSASGQDTLAVQGTKLAPDDSVEARRLLRTELRPTSDYWASQKDTSEPLRATNRFAQIATIAYSERWLSGPTGDSVMAFIEAAGTNHSDPNVRAQFLLRGLQMAHLREEDGVMRRYYKIITANHEGSFYAKEAENFAPDRRVQAGKQLPDFSLPSLEDSTETHEKSDFRGEVLLIDFWGSWCAPCLKEMPHLHEAYETYRDEGLRMLSVAMREDSRQPVHTFRTEKWEMPWTHAYVPDGSDLEEKVMSRFEIKGFPATILVGEDGQILATGGELRGQKLLGTLGSVFESEK